MSLKTEQNTSKMQKRVLASFRLWGDDPRAETHAVFEHGHWWVIDTDNGGNWSVIDATGPGTVDGFDFECVTEPSEN
jgi:hypothetical protein